MSKATQKSNQPQVIFNIIISVIIALIALTALTTLQRFDHETQDRKQADFIQNNTAIYNHKLLSFCYEQNIHPCDKIAIEEWNASNPNSTFVIQSPAQLGDESNRLTY